MKTIDSLSGVEFENLCQTLLSRMGFYVETTATTGDGGIDLIAYYDKPLLSGKYVIQCKRYSGSVGVAIIRELFGVISDTRANKGILITSSEFTNQAKEYAKDKNIELIDRHKLETLLHEYSLAPDSGKDGIHFDQIDSFPKDKHEFYKDLIARNLCTQDLAEDYLFNFLFNYLSYSVDDTLESVIHINYSGLSQEYLRVFNWYAKKYLSTGKKAQKLLPYYTKKYQGLAQLHNFDLFDYVQARYDELTHFSPLTLSTHLSSNPEQTNYKLCNIPEEKHAEIIDALAHRNYEKVKYRYSTYDCICQEKVDTNKKA